MLHVAGVLSLTFANNDVLLVERNLISIFLIAESYDHGMLASSITPDRSRTSFREGMTSNYSFLEHPGTYRCRVYARFFKR